ncbi:MAG: cell division protein ZapD [Gammaproteobacteria bacterium]|nr:cell division protein ZapD [Gammaproteobacteria bacterium]
MERQESIIFEQPLNEHTRIYLRLEHLFKQAEHYLDKQNVWEVYQALHSILDLMIFLDRPDIKTKLSNAIIQHITALNNLTNNSDVDSDKLLDLIERLNKTKSILHNIRGRFAPDLYSNDFLAAAKKRISSPAGACNYALPALHLWLKQPHDKQQQVLNNWFKEFSFLQDTVNLLLDLVRNSSSTEDKKAQTGFYQDMLASNINYQLVRVTIPMNLQLYPEASLGRHRLSIYFYEFDLTNRRRQIDYDVAFKLQLGRI